MTAGSEKMALKWSVTTMARFETEGLNELIDSLDHLQITTDEFAERMLFAGAEEIRKAWRRAAVMHGLIDTSEMHDSIGYPKTPTRARDMISLDIYPQGFSKTTSTSDGNRIRRKKKVRNAAKAFILHYGSSKILPTHWVDTADDLAGPEVERVCFEIYENWLRENGFL